MIQCRVSQKGNSFIWCTNKKLDSISRNDFQIIVDSQDGQKYFAFWYGYNEIGSINRKSPNLPPPLDGLKARAFGFWPKLVGTKKIKFTNLVPMRQLCSFYKKH